MVNEINNLPAHAEDVEAFRGSELLRNEMIKILLGESFANASLSDRGFAESLFWNCGEQYTEDECDRHGLPEDQKTLLLARVFGKQMISGGYVYDEYKGQLYERGKIK